MKNIITKADLIARMANNAGMTKADAGKALDAFTKSVGDILAEGDIVSLVGFGKFEAVLQKGKSGTVPGTDRTYQTEDKLAPKFYAGKGLKDKIIYSTEIK